MCAAPSRTPKSDRAGRFELAEGGTLFLDEIGNMSAMSQQAKILRVIETGRVRARGLLENVRASVRLDVRDQLPTSPPRLRPAASGRISFSASTHPASSTATARAPRGYRAAGAALPQAACRRYRKGIAGFDEQALQALPRLFLARQRERTRPCGRTRRAHGARARSSAFPTSPSAPAVAAPLEDMSLEEVEALLIKKTLARCDGNARRAADELGLSRSAFYRRLEKYKL
jgi:hypothetical protein